MVGKFITIGHFDMLENQDTKILKDKISLLQMFLTPSSCRTGILYLEGYKTWAEFRQTSNMFLSLLTQKVK